MGILSEYFHHLLSPHCEECAHERECRNCEILRMEIESMRQERDKLIEALIQKSVPTERIITSNEKPASIKPRVVPWSVRRQALEQEDRHRAQLMNDAAIKAKSTRPNETKNEEITLEELEAEMHRAEGERNASQ